MPYRKNLPINASVATPDEAGRLFAPSAARNAGAITAMIRDVAPADGRALELASGTGQHIVELAEALPDLDWQPSDVAPERRASIDGYVAASGLTNLQPAVELDATAAGWGVKFAGQNLILLVNLLHLVSEIEAQVLVQEAAQALAASGTLVIYGPFMRDDALTSEGDAAFHASLRTQDPEIGYKSDFEVVDWGLRAGLEFGNMVEMPANNLALIWRKPG